MADIPVSPPKPSEPVAPKPAGAPVAPAPKPPTKNADVEALVSQFGSSLTQLEDTVPNIPTFLLSDRRSILDVARHLQGKLGYEHLALITAIDTKKDIELVYNFWSYSKNRPIGIKVRAPYNDLVVPSLTSLWATADWHEREEYDLMGVRFEGHPDLRRILLPEGWQGHPLRKDYPNFKEQYVSLDPVTGQDIVHQEPREGAW